MFKVKHLKYLILCLSGVFFIQGYVRGITGMITDNTTRIDSLQKVLGSASPRDKPRLLLVISKDYQSVSLDSSRSYATKALTDAKGVSDSGLIADACKLLGNINYLQGNYPEVMLYYDSSLSMYSRLNDSAGLAKIWNNLGIFYQSIGDYEKSISYHLKSVECKRKLGDINGLTSSFNNIGSIYYDLQDYSRSKEYFQKALDNLSSKNEPTLLANIYNNLGVISQEIHQFELSLDYFKKALAISQQQGLKDLTGTVYHNIGKSKFLMGEFQEALTNYFISLKILDSLGIVDCHALNNIGQVYIELDYYQEAQKYLYKALEIAKKNNQFIYLREIYNNLAVSFEREKKFEKAYHYYLLFKDYDDSLKNQMYSNRIENIQTQNELNQKQKEIEKLSIANQLINEKRENDRRKQNYAIYTFLAGIAAIFIIAGIVYHMFRQKSKANQKLKLQNEEIARSGNTIRKINKALTENEDMLRRIFDASPSAIIVMNTEMNILDCNNAGIRMFKASNKRDLLNKDFRDFLKNGQESPSDPFPKIFENGNEEPSSFAIRRTDSTEFMAELSGGVISDITGKPSAYVVIITDVTERLQNIENLNQARMEAEESDRLKTAFLANMSHEIRTPMNSIIGFSNLLSETDIQDGKKDEYLKHIMQSSNILLNLIDDIIDISKIEAGQININMVETQINKTIREIYSSFNETRTKKDIELRLKLPPESELITVKTDPLRIKQIVTNLIGNALKFTKKGFIEIGYNIRNNANERHLEFYVKDTGIGIPADKQSIIFERFRQVDEARTRKFGGTGLGLAISKRLVNLLGGNIWVVSKLNEGSVFYFTIPIATNEETEKDTESFQASKFDWKGKTILIAEDENSNFELLKASIYRTGVRIVRAHNGDEAVEYISRHNGVDLVLMDIRMPRMNGYEATRIIKSKNPDIPVISITAYAMSEDRNKSLEAGCDMYISKPVKPSNLLAILNDFIVPS